MLFRMVALVKKTSAVLCIFLAFSGIILFTAQSYSTEDSTQISLAGNPRMLAINTVTNRTVVTHWLSNAVSIVDLNFGSLIAQLPVGRLPRGAAIDTGLNMAVITYQGERSISLIDLDKNRIAADIYIGNYTGHVAVDSQTHTAVVTSLIDLHVYFVDLVQKKVVAKPLAGLGMGDVAVDPSQHKAYVLNPLAKSLKIFDMTTFRLSDTIALEKFPKAIDCNPEQQTILITNYLDQTLTKIDLLTRRSFILPANRFPLDVAYNTIDNRAAVLCDLDRKLLLLDLNTNEILNTYLLPRHPQSVAVNSIRNIAVVADDETDGLTIIPLPLSPSLPQISITAPLDNARLTSETVNVTGTVENSTNVTVNGVAASVAGKTFSATLTLKAGQNTLAAIATDQYGRTACHSILVEVVLPVKGKITGTVTNAATGLLLPLAIITITDSTGYAQTLATIISGTYTAEVAPGAFTGTVIKPWYLPYSFSGTVAAGETATMNALLMPAAPVISNIIVSEIKADSAKISWARINRRREPCNTDQLPLTEALLPI